MTGRRLGLIAAILAIAIVSAGQRAPPAGVTVKVVSKTSKVGIRSDVYRRSGRTRAFLGPTDDVGYANFASLRCDGGFTLEIDPVHDLYGNKEAPCAPNVRAELTRNGL